MKVVFMGTPEFAVPTLERLVADGYEVALVVTQPDRPAGRGRKLVAPPVKEVALNHGLRIAQPERLRDEATLAALRAASPEVIVVAAFGQILPRAVLSLPRLGCVNVHASLLPRWRGAAPIAAAILAGDELTGVTIMLMEAGLDTGPILARRETPIAPTDTTGSLTAVLSRLGAEALAATLPRWASGDIAPVPQDDTLATYAPQLKKEHGELEWTKPAVALWRQVRAFHPWPGAFTVWGARLLRVLEAVPLALEHCEKPGKVVSARTSSLVGATPYPELLPATKWSAFVTTPDGALLLARVQMEGSRPMEGAALLAGYRDLAGAALGRS